MSTATKVTFGLAGFFMIVSVFAASYLSVRIQNLTAEAINAPTREMQITANQAAYKHRAYYRKVWLLPALTVVLSFFGWVEYFKSEQREHSRAELIGGILISAVSVLMLVFLGVTFVIALGGHA